MSDLHDKEELARHLMIRAQNGDSDAFRSLVHCYYDRIFRWALTQTGSPNDADDVTQQVLMSMYRRIDTYRGEARFTTWLYRITRNIVLEDRRRRQRRNDLVKRHLPSYGGASATPDMENRIDQSNLVDWVYAFFNNLPERQREVFDLVDLQGFNPTDVADMLDMKPGTVRTNLFKARRTIRAKLVERHPELSEAYTA